MVPVIELFHSYTLHSCSARYGPHITLPNLRGHIWPWLQTGKLLGNVNSLYMITLVMLVSFGNNAVDISVTAMHPTKKLETENCLHWTLNERKKNYLWNIHPLQLWLANIRLQDIVAFLSSVSREETPEQTIPDVQLGHLASTLHCLTWNLVSVQSQGNTGIKPIVICTVPEQKEQLIRLYCMWWVEYRWGEFVFPDVAWRTDDNIRWTEEGRM